MKTKTFVAFYLVLTFGHTFARNLNQSKSGQTSAPEERAQRDDDSWNPLAELLGIPVRIRQSTKNEEQGDSLSDLFDRHSSKMEKAMEEHQEMMDKAMEEHQKVMDSMFGPIVPVMRIRHNNAMSQHQSLMDRAMEQHQKDMDDFDKNWAQFDKDMDDMFKNFDKHFGVVSAPFQPLKQVERSLEAQPQGSEEHPVPQPEPIRAEPLQEQHNSRPVPERAEQPIIIRTDEKLANNWANDKLVDVEEKAVPNARNKTGLPVFHPNGNNSVVQEEYIKESEEELPALINHIMEGFQPVINDLQEQVQDHINSSYQMAEKALTVDNETNSDDNSTVGGLFNQFMDSMINTVSELGSLIVNGLGGDDNETMVEVSALPRMECGCPLSKLSIHRADCPMNMSTTPLEEPEPGMTTLDRKLKIAYVLHALENVLMARITKVPFEDYNEDLQNLYNLGFNEIDINSAKDNAIEFMRNNSMVAPYGAIWTKVPWEVSDIETDHLSKLDALDNVAQVVVSRILAMIDEAKRNAELEQNKMSADRYIAKQLRTEFVIKKGDDEYEWYEWVTVGLIAGTSSLLLIVALFMCFQKTRRSASVKLDGKGADGEGVVAKNSYANENLNNKYKEKIKTIFVNLKT